MPEAVVIGESGRLAPSETIISADELPVNLQETAGDFDPNEDAIDFCESLEGMRVTIEDAVAVSPTRVFGNFSAEAVTLPNQGAGVTPEDRLTERGAINLSSGPDNTGDQNPERVQSQFNPNLMPDGFDTPALTVGDQLGDVTGVVGYSFGNFEVNVNNHLTSRFGSSPVYGGPQPFVQAGEAEREAQAQALNDFVDSIVDTNPDAKVIVLGDLNTFEFTNDLSEILPGVGDERMLTNLADGDAYTFIFDGNSQVLDHMFVTDSLLEGAEFPLTGMRGNMKSMRRLVIRLLVTLAVVWSLEGFWSSWGTKMLTPTMEVISPNRDLGITQVASFWLFEGDDLWDLVGVGFPFVSSDDCVNRNRPMPETGSLSEYIGFRNDRYFIEVPDHKINDFFSWDEAYPDLISAHRGGFTRGFPENAIATFAHTLTIAPALLEVDVRRTADGEWILMHDDTLDRTTTGSGLVSETTLAEIQALQLVDNDGTVTDFRVPTLQEALEWAEGRTILELDLKSDDFFEEVAQIITDLDAEDQTRFITQNLEQAISIYNLNPEIHLGLFITANNQANIFAGIEAAPFDFENVSAFTGTRPQTAEFYGSLHEEGIVAIQGLFGDQDFFGESTLINDLTDEQRTELFETVYARGGDAIASDFSQPISQLLDYSESPLPRC